MLGKGVFLLLSIVIVSAFTPSVFADENSELIILEIDKGEYYIGDSLTVSGVILEKKMPVIAMRVYDPDGGILSANNVEIEKDDTFSKIIFLDEPFYTKSGTYEISFDYGKVNSQIEFTLSDENIVEPEIIEITNPEILIFTTDKDQYIDGDFVTISGIVSEESAPTVLIGLYDPFGFPAGFYFGDITSDLEFTTSFLIKDGVNFKTFGTYSAIAYYEESEEFLEFDYVETQNLLEEPDTVEEPIDTHDPVEDTVGTPIAETKDIPKDESPKIDEPEIDTQKISPIENKIPKETITPSNTKVNEKKIIQSPSINKKPVIPIKENNLSVEDIALGIMLNQITLSCDDGDYSDSISYYDGMGPALMRLCNFGDALEHFDLALLDDPNNIQILTNKGSALNKLGFHIEAISFFDHALEIDPNFLPAINNKANALINLGQIQDAVENYNLVLSLDPQFTLAKENLNIAQKQFSNNLQFMNYEDTGDIPIDSITQITNKVADSTVNTVNKINENPSNVFEQIGVVFSMIGTSFFSFLN